MTTRSSRLSSEDRTLSPESPSWVIDIDVPEPEDPTQLLHEPEPEDPTEDKPVAGGPEDNMIVGGSDQWPTPSEASSTAFGTGGSAQEEPASSSGEEEAPPPPNKLKTAVSAFLGMAGSGWWKK